MATDQYDVRSLRAALASANERIAELELQLQGMVNALGPKRRSNRKVYDEDLAAMRFLQGQGISLSGIASALGLCKGTVSLYLNGKLTPQPKPPG